MRSKSVGPGGIADPLKYCSRGPERKFLKRGKFRRTPFKPQGKQIEPTSVLRRAPSRARFSIAAGSKRSPHPSSQVFVEKLQRSAPRQFCCRLVITRGRVVVEAVIGSFVDIRRVIYVIGLQCGLESGPSRVDAIVESPVVNK